MKSNVEHGRLHDVSLRTFARRSKRRRAGAGHRELVLALLCAIAALGAGCSRAEPEPPADRSATSSPAETAAPAAPDATRRIVFLGDSLTAGLGVAPAEAYPAIVQARVRDAGLPHEVVNAGVSGDTSAGGVRRLDWSLKGQVDVLVVALGANDGLRGLAPRDLEANLGTIIERARGRGIAVLLAGMEAPPNFGESYTRQFRAVYPAVAKRYDVPLLPFLLADVAGNPSLNQADGIHPNPKGHRIIADLMWGQLKPLLTSRQTQ
jgi:acyl-CoA thioesterase I